LEQICYLDLGGIRITADVDEIIKIVNET
jgi:prophage maintenance system killer protein